MNREPISKIVARALNCNESELDADDELGVTPGWDSFAYMNILIELEKQYAITIDEESVTRLKRYSEILILEE